MIYSEIYELKEAKLYFFIVFQVLLPIIKDVVAYDNGEIYGINKDNQNIKIHQHRSAFVVTDEFKVTQSKLNTSELQYSNVDVTSHDNTAAVQRKHFVFVSNMFFFFRIFFTEL